MTPRLALAFLLLAAAAARADDRPAAPAATEVDRLLDAGKLDEALAALGAEDAEARRRAAAIRDVAAAQKLAAAYQGEDRPQRALAALAEVKALPAIQADPPLRALVGRLMFEVERPQLDLQRARVTAALAEGRRLRDDQHFAEAIALYDQLLSSSEPLAAGDVAAAREGKLAAERGRVEASGFWRTQLRTAIGALSTILIWLACLAVLGLAAASLMGLSRLRRRRPGLLLRVDDLTTTGEVRAAAGPQLAQALKARLTGSSATASGRPDLDANEDFDRSGLANLRLEAKEIDPLESVVADADPVKLGVVSFTPRQLYKLGRGLFDRAYESSVVATVVSRGDDQMLAVQVRAAGATEAAYAETGLHPPNERDRMLDEAADLIVFRLPVWKASLSWSSFRCYRTASRLLGQPTDPARRREVLDQACKLLQSAVAHDATNLLARLRLAITLRKLGRNVEAAAILEQLRDATNNKADRPPWLEQVLTANPGLQLTVRYNLAVTRTKLDDEKTNDQAVSGFMTLSTIPDDPKADPEQCRMLARIRLLAQAGTAAALLWRVERGRPDKQASRDPADAATEAAQAIDGIVDALEASTTERDLDRHAYNSALAVAYNAHGRTCYLLQPGDAEAAVAPLVKAVSCNPALACAHVNLAQAYRRHRKRTPNWARQAEIHLRLALELSPENQKAHFLLGTLLMEPSNLNLEQAKKHLLASNPTPQAHMALVDLLIREKDREGALRLLESSIRNLPEPVDRRFFVFIQMVADLPAESLQPDVVDAADEIAKAALRNGRGSLSDGERKGIERRLQEIHARGPRPPAAAPVS